MNKVVFVVALLERGFCGTELMRFYLFLFELSTVSIRNHLHLEIDRKLSFLKPRSMILAWSMDVLLLKHGTDN